MRTPPPQPWLTLNCARAAGALPAHAGRPEAGSWPRRAPPDLLDTTTTRDRGARRSNARPPTISSSPPPGARCCGAARRVGGLPVRIFAREKKCRDRTRGARPRGRKTAEIKISSSRRPLPPSQAAWALEVLQGVRSSHRFAAPSACDAASRAVIRLAVCGLVDVGTYSMPRVLSCVCAVSPVLSRPVL